MSNSRAGWAKARLVIGVTLGAWLLGAAAAAASVVVNTEGAVQIGGTIDQAELTGSAQVASPGRVGYFEFGDSPTQLNRRTEPRVLSGEPETLIETVSLLRPGHTTFYRLAVENADGTMRRGVTRDLTLKELEGYEPKDPCPDVGREQPHRVNREVVVVCTQDVRFSGFPFKDNGYRGRLVCPKEFPRNLNAKTTDVVLWIPVHPARSPNIVLNWRLVTDGPDVWRTSGHVKIDRWMLFPGPWGGKGLDGSVGGESPLRQGWTSWHASNWSIHSERARYWIYCTSNWSAPSGLELM